MPTLSGMTIAQDRLSTQAQISSAMATRISGLTKRQLILLDLWCMQFDKDARMTIPQDPQVTRRADGEITQIAETNRNALGAITDGRVATWSYYQNKCVDTIIAYQTDASGIEVAGTRRVIKHSASGGQPTVA